MHFPTSATKFKVLAAVLLIGTLASQSAFAQYRHHHRHGPRIGFYIGAPLLAYSFYRPYYPSYYYAPAYYPPVVVAPVPQTYIEQPQPQFEQAPLYQPEQPQAASQPSSMWYYCDESRTYYPYVKSCPAGWQQVTPRPQN